MNCDMPGIREGSQIEDCLHNPIWAGLRGALLPFLHRDPKQAHGTYMHPR